jgi:Tfp pilus assembly protein PilX
MNKNLLEKDLAMETIEKIQQGQERGFILITTYLVIFVMATICGALFWRHMAYANAVARNTNRLVAFNMAEAGLDQAMVAIANPDTGPTYAGSNGYVSMDAANVRGGYNVTVCPPSCDGVEEAINPGYRLVRSTGETPDGNPASSGYESRTVHAYVGTRPSSLFQFAIFSNGNITMSGNATTDAYDSAESAYSSAVSQIDGDIGTNATGIGAIDLNGNNVRVKGDAIIGPGGNVETAITGNNLATKILGTKSVQTQRLDYEAKTTDISYTTITLNQKTPTALSAGTYRLHSLTITGKESLAPTGPTVLYVDGPVSIAGQGIATASNRPRNLIIYVTTSDTVSLSGQGDFYGGIYAPLSHIQNTGQGALYGAAIGNTYSQSGNGAVHFDQDLKRISGGPSQTIQIQSWQEQNPTVTG